MKGVKQVPGEEQLGSRDPSACREVFGHIRTLKIIFYHRSLLCAVQEAADSTLVMCTAEQDTASTQS